MKAAKRSILICVLTLILSVSLLAGVTFAWFTDSITNSGNTIQSGELAIDATAYDRVDAAETDGLTVTISEGNVASGTYYFEAEGASLRNGDPVITEENWQPGDMNAKLFTVSNEGSIDAVVSLDFFVSGDLAQYLWYDFIAVNPADGTILGEFLQRNDLTTLQTLAADREFTLSPAADLEDGEVSQVTFLFVYGLPTSATNEAMNKAVNVNVVVSAKQNVEGAEGPVVVNPGTDLSETTIDSGDTILLSEGDYEVSQPVTVEGKQNIVIDGNGATIKASSAEGASIMSATSKSIAVAADTQTDLANNIINVSGATNVTIRNLTIEGALHHGINIWECENVVLENVTIINSDATAITINGSNVTLNSVTTSGSGWGGVNVDLGNSGSSEITVDENCAFGEYLQIYADDATIADNVTVNAEGYNKFTVTAHDGNTRILWTNDSAVTEGCAFVNTSLRLKNAILANSDIILLNDVDGRIDMFKMDYVPGYDRANEKAASFGAMNYSGTINLNGYTLDLAVAYTRPLVIGQNFSSGNYGAVNNVTIKNGTLIAAGLLVLDGATLTVEDVEYNSTLTSFGVQCKGSTLNVVDSTVISTDAFVIGTNASEKGKDGTGTHGVIINVTGSTLKSDYIYKDSGSVTVFFNVPGNLNITDSEIYGVQNAVMVRGGTAVISGSTLTTAETIAAGSEDKFTTGNWGTGNSVPYATLLVGNGTPGSYKYSTYVTLIDTKITSLNENVPQVYVCQVDPVEPDTVNYYTFLALDYDTQNKSGIHSADGITVAGNNKKITCYFATADETLVTNLDELNNALKKSNNIVLTNSISLTEGSWSLTVNEGQEVKLLSAGIFDLYNNAQLTVVNNGKIFNTYDSELGLLFRTGGNSQLTLKGNGEYVAGLTAAQAGDNSVITVNGGTFSAFATWNDAYWILNLIDNSPATISVTAGTFVNYDPSNSKTENPVANFVAEGYTATETTEGDNTIYTVVKA